MPSKRRRRRGREPARERPVRARVPGADRRRTEWERTERRLRRQRTVVGVLGVAPLLGSLGCTTGVVALFCAVPREWYLAVWAAIFGTFLGLTIRLILERRRFERAGG